MEQDHKGQKTRQVCHDHTEGGNDKIRPVAHLALDILNDDLPVDRSVELQTTLVDWPLICKCVFFVHSFFLM